jgi:protein ImuA
MSATSRPQMTSPPQVCSHAKLREADAEPLGMPRVKAKRARRQKRAETIAKLRCLVERIEGCRPDGFGTWATDPSAETATRQAERPEAPCWRLGTAMLDDRLGARGIEVGGVHEIRPSSDAMAQGWAGAASAAAGFALALCARHREAVDDRVARLPVAFCQTEAVRRELGQVYPWGLASYALRPCDLLLPEARRDDDVLWAAEECLRSGGVRCLIVRVRDVDLTPARRLALAAAESGTPCLLLTDARAPVVAATATRWCVAPAPCAPDRYDADAPGARRFSVVLDRFRGRPFAAQPDAFALEWCDETFCFRVVAGLRDRAPSPHLATGEVVTGAFRQSAHRQRWRATAA